MRVWTQGRLLADPAEPTIRVDDHGVTVGDGVFETLKVTRGTAFAPTRHLERLGRSAAGLGLPAPDLDEVQAGMAAVLDGVDDELGRLRVTLTAGPAPYGSGRGDGPATLVVAYVPSRPWPASTAVVTVPWRRNELAPTAGLKTTSYADNVVALAYAQERGASEALFLNTAGDLCEGTGSCVFYVVDGELRTPSLATGCLAGVTRALVLEWFGARETAEPVVATQVSEAFLASTTRDVQPVHRWDDVDLPAPGPVTAHAVETWARREAEHPDP